MRIAILESIVMPAGHEVEFDCILVEELKKQGHEPVFFVPEHFPFKLDYHCDVEYLEGGEDKRFYELPMTEARKTMEEIPTRKRNYYRKRYALLDEVDASVAEKIRLLLK